MSDPLAQMVALLRPQAALSKVTTAAGPWQVRRSESGQPFYCAILDGTSRLAAEGHDPFVLEAGDFVLIPAARDFTMSSAPPPVPDTETLHTRLPGGDVRLGDETGPETFRALVGYCVFESPDAGLLVSLLPRMIHVRGDPRLASLVALVGDETRARRPGRETILAHLLDVLFIEALRSTDATAASPGLLRGLADGRIAPVLRQVHDRPGHAWTVRRLAETASLSRSAFFERFQRVVGTPPMDYLLSWRMALAKDLLRRRGDSIAGIAERVGYGSASTFSTAFLRQVGQSPALYARGRSAIQASASATSARRSRSGRAP